MQFSQQDKSLQYTINPNFVTENSTTNNLENILEASDVNVQEWGEEVLLRHPIGTSIKFKYFLRRNWEDLLLGMGQWLSGKFQVNLKHQKISRLLKNFKYGRQ